jgi:exopolyphosphatase/guanosine-5'-triphosphate,3'-diphosphate pyrophosphatase
MRVASLDLGTNTFLCLLAEGDAHGISSVHKDMVEVVRLGQGVDKYKVFHPYALSRARACLAEFKKSIDAFKPDRILAVATSAARDVGNSEELFKIGKELQIPIQVIEGQAEAQVSFQGALVGFDVLEKNIAVIDIGGGSTEVITGIGGQIQSAQSLNVGGVRLTEKFITQQPVPTQEQTNLRQFLLQQLENFEAKEAVGKSEMLIAVAGTPTTLAVLELGVADPSQIDGFQFDISQLIKWQNIFCSSSVEQKKSKYNLGGRADIIYAGTTILIEFMKRFNFARVAISTKGVRYGVALQLLQKP